MSAPPPAATPSTSSAPNPAVFCTCSRSGCLKLYCRCFQVGQLCGPNCSCNGCHNCAEHEEEREQAIAAIKLKNPNAFFRTSLEDQGENYTEIISCNCNKSRCIKKYCLCRTHGRKCTEHCKCTQCKNGKPDEHSHSHGSKHHSGDGDGDDDEEDEDDEDDEDEQEQEQERRRPVRHVAKGAKKPAVQAPPPRSQRLREQLESRSQTQQQQQPKQVVQHKSQPQRQPQQQQQQQPLQPPEQPQQQSSQQQPKALNIPTKNSITPHNSITPPSVSSTDISAPPGSVTTSITTLSPLQQDQHINQLNHHSSIGITTHNRELGTITLITPSSGHNYLAHPSSATGSIFHPMSANQPSPSNQLHRALAPPGPMPHNSSNSLLLDHCSRIGSSPRPPYSGQSHLTGALQQQQQQQQQQSTLANTNPHRNYLQQQRPGSVSVLQSAPMLGNPVSVGDNGANGNPVIISANTGSTKQVVTQLSHRTLDDHDWRYPQRVSPNGITAESLQGQNQQVGSQNGDGPTVSTPLLQLFRSSQIEIPIVSPTTNTNTITIATQHLASHVTLTPQRIPTMSSGESYPNNDLRSSFPGSIPSLDGPNFMPKTRPVTPNPPNAGYSSQMASQLNLYAPQTPAGFKATPTLPGASIQPQTSQIQNGSKPQRYEPPCPTTIQNSQQQYQNGSSQPFQSNLQRDHLSPSLFTTPQPPLPHRPQQQHQQSTSVLVSPLPQSIPNNTSSSIKNLHLSTPNLQQSLFTQPPPSGLPLFTRPVTPFQPGDHNNGLGSMMGSAQSSSGALKLPTFTNPSSLRPNSAQGLDSGMLIPPYSPAPLQSRLNQNQGPGSGKGAGAGVATVGGMSQTVQHLASPPRGSSQIMHNGLKTPFLSPPLPNNTSSNATFMAGSGNSNTNSNNGTNHNNNNNNNNVLSVNDAINAISRLQNTTSPDPTSNSLMASLQMTPQTNQTTIDLINANDHANKRPLPPLDRDSVDTIDASDDDDYSVLDLDRLKRQRQ